jgi:PAS domain S-box-containing protein
MGGKVMSTLKANFRVRLSGLLLTLCIAATAELMIRAASGTLSPLPVYLIAVAYATLSRGIFIGLLSAAITLLYFLYVVSIPGHLFSFATDNLLPVLVSAATTALIIVVVGCFRRRADRLTEAPKPERSPKGRLVDQMLAEQQLDEINETLRALVSASPLAIIVFDTEGNVKLWSPAAEHIFGWTEQEVLDRPLPTVPPGNQEEFRVTREAVLRGEALSGIEARRRKKDGSLVDIRFYTAGIRDTEGNIRRIMSIVDDISMYKHEEGMERLLADTSALLSSSLDYQATLASLANRIVPQIADWCAIYVPEGDGTIRQLVAAHTDKSKIALASELQRRYPPHTQEKSGVAQVLTDGKSQFYPALTDAMLASIVQDDAHLQLLRQFHFKALLIAPLAARGHTFGALVLAMSESGRSYTSDDLAVAEELGCRAGAAVDNARLFQEANHARRAAERAAERTFSLLELTSALSDVLTPSQIGEVVVSRAISALGAVNGGLMLLNEDDSRLEVVHLAGYPSDLAQDFQNLPIDAPMPQTDAVRNTELLWFSSAEALSAAYPDLRSAVDRMKCNAWASIPVAVKDHLLGGISLAFSDAHDLSDDDKTFMLAVAEQCAQALERARLYSAERRARTDAEGSRSRLAFLAEASAMLASSLEYGASLSSLARFMVPYLADWCVIDMVEDDNSIRRLAIAHADPSKGELARLLQRRYPVLQENDDHTIVRALRTGQSWFDPEVSEERLAAQARNAEHLALLTRLGFTSEMVVPIAARSRIAGTITFVRGEGSPNYGPADLALAEEVARRAGVAVDHARLYYTARQARQAAERAADRTIRLQKITAALSEALTPTQVAHAVLDQGVMALAASAGLVALLAEEGTTLEIIASTGYSQRVVDKWLRFSTDLPMPEIEAVQSGNIVWLESTEDRHVRFADSPRLDNTNKAWGVIPLIVEGHTIGALSLSFATPRKLREDDEAFLLALARQCAQALERARLYEAERLARAEAERTADRIARLQKITAALSEALTPAQVAEVVIDHGMAALGATAGVVIGLIESSAELELVSYKGYAQKIGHEWNRFPLDSPAPIADAVRTQTAIWLESYEERLLQYPEIAVPQEGHQAWACIPLVVEGNAIGALGFSFLQTQQFQDDDKQFAIALARQCAQAMERARLYEMERQARAEVESTQERLVFLSEASAVLASSLDYEATLPVLARLVLPALADYCLIDVVEVNGQTRRIATAHADPEKEQALGKSGGNPYDKSLFMQASQAVHSGKTVVMSEHSGILTAATPSDTERQNMIQALAAGSTIIVPMLARGRTLGSIALSREDSSRAFGVDDLDLAEEMAHRAALAVDNARLYYEAQQARQTAEQAADRTARLQAITAALSEALTVDQVARAVIDEGIAALEATAGSLSLRNENNAYVITHAVGLPAALLEAWRRNPAAGPLPITDAINQAEPIWIESQDERLKQHPSELPDLQADAWAILPLIVGGDAIGAISFSFARSRRFSIEDRAFMLALARQCTQALERARLYAETQASAEILRQKVAQRTDELQRALVRAQSADQAKSALLSTVSHEMRTPLSSIIGFSNLILSRNPEPGKTVEYVNVINDEARRLANLVNDFLDLQRIEAGREVFHFAELDLKDLIQDVVSRQQWDGDDLHTIELALPSVPRVYADGNRIRQVILNLLSNAIKYSPNGGQIRIKVTQVENEVHVSVGDQGFGIPENELTEIFERFHRGNIAEQYRIGGTGLGLALCREIVSGHSGRIWAESPGPNLGSTFTFTLPIRSVSERGQFEPKRRRSRSSPADKLIVIIEDDLNFAAYLGERLEMEGYFVHALRFAASKPDELARLEPSMIILDVLQGTEQVGWSLLAKLKQHSSLKDVPAMICSVLHDPQRAAQLGAASCIAKPVDESFLLGEITRLIGAPAHKVLVVDDSETVRILLEDTLAGAGYQIQTADDGQQAIDILKLGWPDLIILDLLMPNIDGFEVMDWIRNEQQNTEIPIIAFSAAELTADELQVVKERASAYAIKSHTSPQQLLDLIKQVMATQAP